MVSRLVLLDGVRWCGEEVTGVRSRALLVALAAAAPSAVSSDALVAQVWGEDPPAHPDKALQVLVSRTRTRTDADAIVHTGTGYRLALPPADVDVLDVERLAAAAVSARSAGDDDLARLHADAALAVPVVDAADDPLSAELVARAQTALTAAARAAAAAAVATGDHDHALHLLEPLVAAHPADEALLSLLLRSESVVRGVPAALARYAAYAESVRERLGAEPGEGLRRLHLDLLAREAPVREGLTYDAVPMIGRDHDVSAIRGLLDRHRVVSIVGPGGLGKTRMAHLVGHLAEQPVVHLVELAGVSNPDDVLPEVASALGVRDSVSQALQPGWLRDLRSRVAQQLGAAPTLLVIDNCEHLVAAVADLVAFLVATVPDVRVVATSRSPLGIAAEQVYLLPQLDHVAAVRLFEQRAVAARPGVRLDRDEVGDLVDQLDGLPLAIELAAAKVRAMSVADVRRRLADRFALLRDGDRSAPERHRTLEAVIDWSWQLLPEPPRETLAALSVFPDGFALSGAEAVLGRDPLPDISHLAEQSLVVVREDDEIRYRFLETVREYAGHRLDEAGERDRVTGRLDAWAIDVSRRLGARLRGPDQIAAMRDSRSEAGNLTGVLRRAITDQDVTTVVPVVATLTNFWTIQGEHATVLGVAESVLDLIGQHDPPDTSERERQELRLVLADLSVGIAIVNSLPPRRAVQQLRALGPGAPGTDAYALVRVVLAVFDSGEEGDLAALEELADDPDPAVARAAVVWLIQLQENSGEVAAAIATARRAVELSDGPGGPWLGAMAQSQLAGLAIQTGDSDLALACAERALPVMEALGALEDTFTLRCAIAMVEVARGDLERAERLVDEVAADERAHRSPAWSFWLHAVGELAFARGEAERGLRHYAEAVAVARERRVPGMAFDAELSPWVLFTESAALHAQLLHGPATAAGEQARALAVRVPRLLDSDFPHLDVPILGKALLAVGTWLLLAGPPDAESAVRMIALGERFGHYRGIPIGSWDQTVALAADRAPGRLDSLREEYAARRAHDLLDLARTLVESGLAEW